MEAPERILRGEGYLTKISKDMSLEFGDVLEVRYRNKWYLAVMVEDTNFSWRFYTKDSLPDIFGESSEGHNLYVSKMAAIYCLREICEAKCVRCGETTTEPKDAGLLSVGSYCPKCRIVMA